VGPRVVAALAVALLVTAAGCDREPAATTTPNATDVMFLQMALEQIREGDQVAATAERHATDTRIRTISTGLRAQWRDETGTMQRWLMGWEQPLTAPSEAGAHDGHGDLHVLRPEDIKELTATSKTEFDRTAVSLLLGNLHNAVETTRMKSASGGYPPARHLADTMTNERQAKIRDLLTLAAGQ
jgi:uncharacterized protein (DUF305 family)